MNLKYKDGCSMVKHTSQFPSIVNKLVVMKMNLDELLSSLHESCETLVVIVSNSLPNGKLIIDLVKENMLNEDASRKEMH